MGPGYLRAVQTRGKLRDFFSVKTVDTVKQSIFTISQLTMLENVCTHLDKMHNDRQKQAKDNPHIEELEAKRQKLETLRKNAFSMRAGRQETIKRTRGQTGGSGRNTPFLRSNQEASDETQSLGI